MKKSLFIIATLFALSATNIEAQQQKYEFEKGTTIQEAKEKMESELDQLEMVRKIQGLGGLRISVGSGSNDDENISERGMLMEEAIPKASDKLKEEVKELLKGQFDDIEFEQILATPDSYISPHLYNNLKSTIGDDSDIEEKEVQYTIRKIYYANGKQQVVNIVGLETPDMQLIDSLEVDISWQYPVKYRTQIVSPKTPNFEVNGVKITLQSVDEDEITLISDNRDLNDVLESVSIVLGVLENGRVAKKTGSNYGTTSTEDMDMLMDLMESVYTRLIGRIDNNEFETAEQIADSINRAILPQLEGAEKLQKQGGSRMTYVFQYDVKELCLVFAEYETYTEKGIVIRRDGLSDGRKTPNEEIAKDIEANKYGIVDINGKWLVKPMYFSLQHSWGDYYDGWLDYEDDTMQTFRFVKGKEKLDPMGFRIYDLDYDANRMFVRRLDSKEGVVDTLGNVIIPIQYDDLVSNSYIEHIVATSYIDSLNHKKEIFDYDGKKLYPEEFFDVKLWSYEVETVQIKEDKVYQAKYNIEDRSLIEETVTPLSDYWGSRMLYLSYDYDEGIYNFSNSQGKIVIKGLEEYEPVSREFNGQRAKVRDSKNRGLYGYIDIKGKLVIPTIYEKAYEFKGRCTYVLKKGQPLLIDLDGNVVKTLTSKLSNSSGIEYGDDEIFELEDGKYYNTDGEEVESPTRGRW